jgi:hypothetical protein
MIHIVSKVYQILAGVFVNDIKNSFGHSNVEIATAQLDKSHKLK